MTLHIKHSGNWQQAQEVHIKHNGSWNQCKEVYVNKNGIWEPVLYESQTVNITALGAGQITVPHGVFRATITINGGAGGRGGSDGQYPASQGGDAASLTATVNVEPFTTFSYNIAGAGTNGASGQSAGAGGTGGTGYALGGAGGASGVAGSSGAGGGGGGASSFVMPDGTVLLVAGGGSGGGGSGHQEQLPESLASGKASTAITSSTSALSNVNGGNGSDRGTDDGGGGGAGGGGVSGSTTFSKTYNANSWGYAYATVSTALSSINDIHLTSRRSHSACTENYSFGTTGNSIWVNHGCRGTFTVVGTASSGAGGSNMSSYDSDGFPGEVGTSYYDSDLINGTPMQASSSGNGSIKIVWLPE